MVEYIFYTVCMIKVKIVNCTFDTALSSRNAKQLYSFFSCRLNFNNNVRYKFLDVIKLVLHISTSVTNLILYQFSFICYGTNAGVLKLKNKNTMFYISF